MIQANIVGEYGDGQIPIWNMISFVGVPIEEYCASVSERWSEFECGRFKESAENLKSFIAGL